MIEIADFPTLDLAFCARELAVPVTKWGTRARADRMEGTWHFYTHDYKFKALITNANRLEQTRCKVAVEPNFSTYPGMHFYEALELTARKRRAALEWQSVGISVIVDLDVVPEFARLNLLGVPRGWSSFATRVHKDGREEAIREDFAIAQEVSGRSDPLFIVFGGGDRFQRLCDAKGWVWVPEHRQVVSGRHKAYGQG